jgi:hypothetical protein
VANVASMTRSCDGKDTPLDPSCNVSGGLRMQHHIM